MIFHVVAVMEHCEHTRTVKIMERHDEMIVPLNEIFLHRNVPQIIIEISK